MINRDLLNIKEGIDKMSDITNVADINFTMTIARINDEVEKELRIIRNGRKKPSEQYKEFLKEPGSHTAHKLLHTHYHDRSGK